MWKTVPANPKFSSRNAARRHGKEPKNEPTAATHPAVKEEREEHEQQQRVRAEVKRLNRLRSLLASHGFVRAVCGQITAIVSAKVDSLRRLSEASGEAVVVPSITLIGLGIGCAITSAPAGVASALQIALFAAIRDSLIDAAGTRTVPNFVVHTMAFDPVVQKGSPDACLLQELGIQLDDTNRMGAYTSPPGGLLVVYGIHCPRTLYHNLLVANLTMKEPPRNADGDLVPPGLSAIQHPLHRLIIIGNNLHSYVEGRSRGPVSAETALVPLLTVHPLKLPTSGRDFSLPGIGRSEVVAAFSDTAVTHVQLPKEGTVNALHTLLLETLGHNVQRWPTHVARGNDMLLS